MRTKRKVGPFVAMVALSLATSGGCALFGGGGPETVAVKELRRIAILPAAYVDLTGGSSCDLCPADLEMGVTSGDAADLLTAFFYEALDSYPRYKIIDYDRVRAVAAAGHRGAAQSLLAGENVDAVVVMALLDLRRREGGDENPTTPAGATIYAALVDASTFDVLWQGTFDKNEKASGRLVSRYYAIVRGDRQIWKTADEFMAVGAGDLVKSMVKRID